MNASARNTTLSQAVRTIAGDVEDIILKFDGKVIRCDRCWDDLLKCLKAEQEADKNLNDAVRIFTLKVEKRQ